MNDTMMQEILKRLDSLGQQLGVGAQYTWVAIMRQEVLINGWGQIALALVFIVAAAALVKLAFWICRPAVDKHENSFRIREYAIDDEVGRAVGTVFSVVGAAGMAIGAVVSLWDGVGHVLNPSYYALMDLAKMLTGK